MAAGMKYKLDPIAVNEEAARFETCYRLSGGFNLVDDNLVVGSYLQSLAPICVDFTTRRAVAVKNIEIVEVFATGGTSMKIKKNSLAYAGMHIGTGSNGATIETIDKTNANYDVLTITALTAGLTVGSVMFEASAVGGSTPKNKANLLNYAVTKVEAGATITAIGTIYEIQKSKLSTPISTKCEASLGARFMFV